MHITWKSRWIRATLQAFVILLLLLIGFLGISLLNILTPPLSNSNVDTSTYTETTIISVTDISILETWCINNISTVLSTSDTALYSLCETYLYKYYSKLAITIGIAIGVVLIKQVLKRIVLALAIFQRYKSNTEQVLDMTINLFVVYTCTTVLILFLLQANIFTISFKGLIRQFIGSGQLNDNASTLIEYRDFTSGWYIDIGYQIWMTMIILVVSPHAFMPIMHYTL